MPGRGFVTNELLNGIAATAVWVGVSLPIYARIVDHLSRGGTPVGVIAHVSALAAAALAPVAIVALLFVVVRVGELVWQRIARRNKLD